MDKKSKIVATIGPASESEEVIRKLLANGANVFRFNLKHNTIEWHREVSSRAKRLAKEMGLSVAIMMDIPSLEMAREVKDADFLAISYLRAKSDLLEVKGYLEEAGIAPKIIAKIENGEAIKNLEDLLEECDGVMVARGDLGREVPIEQLAFWQKKIIELCRRKNKPVIVATEMLQSMTKSNSPTRAEATDVANAIFDGTDALMLSEETAIGEYPAEAVAQMRRIATFCDNEGEVKKLEKHSSELSEILIGAAVKIVEECEEPGIMGVIVFTQSGGTVRKLSSYRLKVPIVAITDNEEILEMLSLSYGVIPFYRTFEGEKFEIESPLFEKLIDHKFFKKGDRVLIIHGNNWITKGSTSDISLKTL